MYYDDTKFANGKVLEWHIMDNDRMSLIHEQYQLEKMKKDLAALP